MLFLATLLAWAFSPDCCEATALSVTPFHAADVPASRWSSLHEGKAPSSTACAAQCSEGNLCDGVRYDEGSKTCKLGRLQQGGGEANNQDGSVLIRVLRRTADGHTTTSTDATTSVDGTTRKETATATTAVVATAPTTTAVATTTTATSSDLQCMTTEGDPCVFPFIYYGHTFTTCTLYGADDANRWCSNRTNDADYHVEKHYGYCVDDEEACPFNSYDCLATDDLGQTGPCLFPFDYDGLVYNGCTNKPDDKLWCALEIKRDGTYKRYGHCHEGCPEHSHSDAGMPGCNVAAGPATAGTPCRFPFDYKGTSYKGCLAKEAGDQVPWCATEDTYDESNWGYCEDGCPIATSP